MKIIKTVLFSLITLSIYAEIPSQETETTFAISGDIMGHNLQLTRAYVPENDSFDFHSCFQYIAPYFQQADIALANLETTIAGKDGALGYVEDTYFRGYQGYYFFNTPESMLAALRDSGFDYLSTANNHTMDSGLDGAIKTWENVKEYEMIPFGTQPKGQESTIFLNSNGINVALISYTFSTNGVRIPEGDFEVNFLDMYREDLMVEMENKVKEAEQLCDIVMVMIHYGSEYIYEPNSMQRNVVDRLFNAGADVILGDHPHVLQPIEFREITEPDGSIRNGFVIYSLGNLISAQRYPNPQMKSKDAGVVLNLTLTKRGGDSWISEVSVVPTWVQLTDENFYILPLEQALAGSLPITFPEEDIERMEFIQQESMQILNMYSDGEPYWDGEKYIFTIPEIIAEPEPIPESEIISE